MLFLCLVNLCDASSSTDESTWPTTTKGSRQIYLKNHIIDGGIVELRPVNATKVDECVRMCCDKINCNYAFLKDSRECYLVACRTDRLCRPLSNSSKKDTDPIDHLIRIRSVGNFEIFN